jgi:hypothetical protein
MYSYATRLNFEACIIVSGKNRLARFCVCKYGEYTHSTYSFLYCHRKACLAPTDGVQGLEMSICCSGRRQPTTGIQCSHPTGLRRFLAS